MGSQEKLKVHNYMYDGPSKYQLQIRSSTNHKRPICKYCSGLLVHVRTVRAAYSRDCPTRTRRIRRIPPDFRTISKDNENQTTVTRP